jgi:ZIP family zinc transporter
VIGVSLLDGGQVGLTTVAAVFLSNVPEGLSSAAGMRKAGRSAAYVFGVWVGIALLSGLAALLGNVALAGASPALIASVTALAAGAILAMLVDTMIPEAFENAHDYAGLITVLGFLAAFVLSKHGG